MRPTEQGKLLQRPKNLWNRSFQHSKDRVYVGLGELFVVPAAIHSMKRRGESPHLSKSKHNDVDSSPLLSQSCFTIAQILCNTQFVSFACKAIGPVTNRQSTSRCNPGASRSQPISRISCFEAFKRNVTTCHSNGSNYNAHSESYERDYTSIAPRDQRKKSHKRATPVASMQWGDFAMTEPAPTALSSSAPAPRSGSSMRDSRWPGRVMRPRVTLSNIQFNPRLKDRGWLTEFVELCDTLIPWPALFVERVQNPKLPTFLRRKGFIYCSTLTLSSVQGVASTPWLIAWPDHDLTAPGRSRPRTATAGGPRHHRPLHRTTTQQKETHR